MDENEQPMQPDASQEYDRRRGPRRSGEDAAVDVERRNQPDRRKKKPGIAGLLGALFGNANGSKE